MNDKHVTKEGLQATILESEKRFVKKEDGKGLSTNDLTNELKGNYDAAHSHSQATHAPAGAEENVIDEIQINGNRQTPSNKSVNIPIPTKLSELSNDAGFQTENDVKMAMSTEFLKYYDKAAIDDKFAQVVGVGVTMKIVDSLDDVEEPDPTTIYLVPGVNGKENNIYDEYFYTEGKWEQIASTQTEVTFDYVTEQDVIDIFKEVFGD